MRVHYLQHVPFEGIDAIGEWAAERGYSVSGTLLSEPFGLPDPADFDFLVVMGGPMNVYEHEAYPWLVAEKAFLRAAIAAGKSVLGVCLGAQLVAEVLGGRVTRNRYREIGWLPVSLRSGLALPGFDRFPAEFTAFQWHGDTFAIPPDAVRVASSAACPNQAFAYAGGRVVGLQFHLEVTPAGVATMLANADGGPIERYEEPWVQGPEKLTEPTAPWERCRGLLFDLLDAMVEVAPK